MDSLPAHEIDSAFAKSVISPGGGFDKGMLDKSTSDEEEAILGVVVNVPMKLLE